MKHPSSIALAMALLILVRDIDLSVAAIVALASMGIGYAAAAGWSPMMLFAVGIGIGLLCGAFNGILVTGFMLPSIVVTIGTMSLFRGLTQVILGDQALDEQFRGVARSLVRALAPRGIGLGCHRLQSSM